MSTFSKDTNNTKWQGSVTLSKQTGTVLSIPTNGKYMDKNIEVTIGVQNATTPSLSITDKASTNLTPGTLSNGYYPFTTSLTGTMSYGTAGWADSSSATDSSVTVGRLAEAKGSVTMTKGSGVVSGSNCTLSTSNTSGISVSGSGSVSATAKITTAGYTPTKTSFASGTSTASNTQTKYLTGVTLSSPSSGSNSFVINDGINTWTWNVDASGNVSII